MTTSTARIRDTFGGAAHGLKLPGIYGRNHYMRPQFDGDDDGGEGDGAGDEGDGEGDGEDDGEPFTGVDLKDENAVVRIPGQKKPVAVKDLVAALRARDTHTQGLQTMGQIAKALREAAAKKTETPKVQPKAKTQPEGDDDPITALEAKDILDGKTTAAVLRKMLSSQEPLVKLVGHMAKELKELRGHVGTFRGERAETILSSDLSAAVTALKLPTPGGKPVEGLDTLQEMARDLFYSYSDEDQPKLKGETFNKLFKTRFDQTRKFFRALEKAELDAAKERQRKRLFTRPGQGSTANGKPRRLLTNSETADILFADAPNT